ncbi:hypothetical protein TNCV_1173401 [Trichonephila clavipes]|uniref:Uncharacterized protein n=1 Tax=Trichonephila clavipes TaxID=2585209 RepID=A0A8X6V3J9_TRICX|nr:hypothetical protein TNCV_1173401 [Trichonephila clavipes]
MPKNNEVVNVEDIIQTPKISHRDQRLSKLLFSILKKVSRQWTCCGEAANSDEANWGETELNRSVTCMVLKATANDTRHLAFFHDEIRGP